MTIGPDISAVTLRSGPPLTLEVRGTIYAAQSGQAIYIPTRRSDRQPSGEVARCQAASASSAASGQPAVAAVDGSVGDDRGPRNSSRRRLG